MTATEGAAGAPGGVATLSKSNVTAEAYVSPPEGVLSPIRAASQLPVAVASSLTHVDVSLEMSSTSATHPDSLTTAYATTVAESFATEIWSELTDGPLTTFRPVPGIKLAISSGTTDALRATTERPAA
jgi:hypothetical protein